MIRQAALCCVAASLTACHDRDLTAIPSQVRVADGSASELAVEVDTGNDTRSDAAIDRAGEALRALGERVRREERFARGEVETLVVTVLGATGADAAVGRRLVRFRLPWSYLQTRYYAMSEGGVLGGAEAVDWLSPANADIAEAHCARRPASGLCRAGARGL